MTDLDYSLRPLVAGDRSYVFSTWIRWCSRESRWLRGAPKPVLFDARDGYVRHIEAALDRCTVVVACDPSDHDVIYGYAVVDVPGVVQFAYVRAPFRRRGVARAMLGAAGVSEPRVFACDMHRWAEQRFDHDPFAAPLIGSQFRAWAIAYRTAFGEFKLVGVR